MSQSRYADQFALFLRLRWVNESGTVSERHRGGAVEQVVGLHMREIERENFDKGCAWADSEIWQCEESGEFCSAEICASKQLLAIWTRHIPDQVIKDYYESLRTGKIHRLDTEMFAYETAKSGNIVIIQFLLKWASDELRVPQFFSPMISVAAKYGKFEAVRLLLDSDIGASEFIAASEKISDVTRTWLAHGTIVRELINEGADLSACKNSAMQRSLEEQDAVLFDAAATMDFSQGELNLFLREACELSAMSRRQYIFSGKSVRWTLIRSTR